AVRSYVSAMVHSGRQTGTLGNVRCYRGGQRIRLGRNRAHRRRDQRGRSYRGADWRFATADHSHSPRGDCSEVVSSKTIRNLTLPVCLLLLQGPTCGALAAQAAVVAQERAEYERGVGSAQIFSPRGVGPAPGGRGASP